MRYVFLGDRLTRPGLAGRPCDPVRRTDGRVVRGRNRNALVVFDTGEVVVVPGRRLRLAEGGRRTEAPVARSVLTLDGAEGDGRDVFGAPVDAPAFRYPRLSCETLSPEACPMPPRPPAPPPAGRLTALVGALLLAACAAAAQPPSAGAAAPPRTYEGAITRPTPDGEAFYYFKYVQDSVLVLGEGLAGDPRVTLPHQSFVTLLRTLHSTGALRDTVALRYALEAQFAPAAPDDLAVSLQAPVLAVLAALALALALVAVGVLYRRARREKAERERERAFRLGLSEAREAERTHFARELHDGPLQDLCAVQLALAALAPGGDGAPPGDGGEAARAAVMAVIADLRGLCDRLRPPALDAFGLPAALEALAQRVARQHPDLHVACRVEADADAPALPPDHQLTLFRIAQEALTNAARHARAARVELTFALTPSDVQLCVDDDGAGPPVRDALDYAREGHYGLLGMRERADLLGAGLRVERSPLGGTRVALTRTSGTAARAGEALRPTIPRRRRSLRRRSAPAL